MNILSSPDRSLGAQLIRSGKVGTIILSGGDGTRLAYSGPKGLFPLSLFQKKSLFQLLIERWQAASSLYGRSLKLGVMASPSNAAATAHVLPRGIDLFIQEELPLLDIEGNPLNISAPSGNGGVLRDFYHSDLYQEWRETGVEIIQVVPIDNPLAEIFDPAQVALHLQKDAEITLKAIERLEGEKVGAIGIRQGHFVVIEYHEPPPSYWKWGSTGLFTFSTSFIEQIKDLSLPLHLVKKMHLDKSVIKRERFLFDLLLHAKKVEIMLCKREETFAPLKSLDDLASVQEALLERDRNAFSYLTKTPKSQANFELHPAFHYPSLAMEKKWLGKPLPDRCYIDP